MQTRFDTTLLTRGPAHGKPWYAPDRRIRTQDAARHAAEVAEWAATGRGLAAEPEEHALFAALHTCAYRAAQYGRSKPATMAERTQWFGSWLIIRDHIVQSNLGLVYAMLRRSYVPDQDEDERLSEALCGLSRAVERFNPWRGCRFSTYACSAITRALLRHRDREARYRQRFPMRYSAAFECPGDKPDFTKPLCVERLARIMAGNHGVLTSIEARVIAERFPECSRRRMTFQEIGDAVSLSKERVRQIQNIALGKLREALEADPLLGPEL